MKASATRAVQAKRGLMLCGALLPGCPSGDKADACTSDEASYGVTLVAGDELTESVKDDLDELMTLAIERAYEAPDLGYNCVTTADNDEDLTERLYTSWASFDREQVRDVPAGWLCAWASGGASVPGESGGYIYCSGDQSFRELEACESVSTELIVTCRTGPDSTEEDGWSDLHLESGGAP